MKITPKNGGKINVQKITRNRPAWQILLGIIIFALVRQRLLTPEAFFSVDRLIEMQVVLFWIVAFFLSVYYLEKIGERGRTLADKFVGDHASSTHTAIKPWICLSAGLIFLISILVALERRTPFFFTQDDNLSQFFPVILQGCHSILHGVFPTWDPYQFLGAPTTSIGVYSLTYPFTYISYFFSRFLLGHEYMTIEVYVIFHLVAGYFAFYWAARSYRVRPSIAVIAALCPVLSGWTLIASRSWFYVSPIYLYMPLIIVGVAKLQKYRTGWKWIISMALVIGLFFHAGNVQFWAYGMMFLWVALVIIWWSGLIDIGKILCAAAASLLGTALSCPLLIPEFLQTKHAERLMPPSWGQVLSQWGAFLVPGPWIHAYKPADSLDAAWKTGGLILYSGTTFTLLAIPLLLCFIFYRFPREDMGKNVWLFCGVVALLGAMGEGGIIWPIMLRLPLLGKFRVPFKFLGFFNVFVALVGAVLLERLLGSIRWSRLIEIGVAVATGALLTVSSMMFLPSFYIYGFKPYPDATAIMNRVPQARAGMQRVMSFSFDRSPTPKYWEGMPHNLPTVYQIPSIFGYDPLVQWSPYFLNVETRFKQDRIRSLKEYGVGYLMVPNFDNPMIRDYQLKIHYETASWVQSTELPELLKQDKELFHDDEISIWTLSGSRPLAFSNAMPSVSIPLNVTANGFAMHTSSLPHGGLVTANFLWYPEMRATADGGPVLITTDSWQRMVINVPDGTKQVSVRYIPEWREGVAVGLILALVGFILGCSATRQNQKINNEEAVLV